MIQHIITPSDKQQWRQKIKSNARFYTYLYLLVLAVSFCISILPFKLKWVSSASIEPREAVVRIETNGGMGSGFLVTPYYILTARHVVEELVFGSEVGISFLQAKIPFETTAKVVYYDKYDYSRFSASVTPQLSDYLEYFEGDVALLQLDEEVRQISPLQLGNSDELKTGNVLVMGYGLDDWSEPEGRITSDSFHENNRMYKLDASINQGHSGGPVMLVENDQPTKVVGIVVGDFSTIFTEVSGRLVRGESVALKINHAEQVLSAGGYSEIRYQ